MDNQQDAYNRMLTTHSGDASECRTIIAAKNGSERLGLDWCEMKAVISLYAKRNNLMYTNIEELVGKREYHDLAKRMAKDVRESFQLSSHRPKDQVSN